MTVPEVSINPSYNNYIEGDEIKVECNAIGNPLPTITWQRLSNRAFASRANFSHNSRLNIKSARLSDAGEYRYLWFFLNNTRKT